MARVEDDLKSFSQFVSEHARDNTEMRLSELFDLWLIRNPNADDYAENVAAINASLNDFLSGERGTPAGRTLKNSAKSSAWNELRNS